MMCPMTNTVEGSKPNSGDTGQRFFERLRKKRPEPEAVDSWFHASLRANAYLPQTHAAISIELGKKVVESLSAGNATWDDFRDTHLGGERLRKTHAKVKAIHTNLGISNKYVTEGRIKGIWNKAKKDVTGMTKGYMKIMNPDIYKGRMGYVNSDQVSDFFSDPEREEEVAILGRLFSASVRGLHTPLSVDIIGIYREMLRQGHTSVRSMLGVVKKQMVTSITNELEDIKLQTGRVVPHEVVGIFTNFQT